MCLSVLISPLSCHSLSAAEIILDDFEIAETFTTADVTYSTISGWASEDGRDDGDNNGSEIALDMDRNDPDPNPEVASWAQVFTDGWAYIESRAGVIGLAGETTVTYFESSSRWLPRPH